MKLLLIGPPSIRSGQVESLAAQAGLEVEHRATWLRSEEDASICVITPDSLETLQWADHRPADEGGSHRSTALVPTTLPLTTVAWDIADPAKLPIRPDIVVLPRHGAAQRLALLQRAKWRTLTLGQQWRARADLANRLRARNTYRRFLQKLAQVAQVDELYRAAAQAVMDVVAARAASVLLWEEEENQMRFSAASGRLSGALLGVTVDAAGSVAGWVARHNESVMLDNAYDDERFNPYIDRVTGIQTGAMICVPMKAGERVLGAVEAINPRDRDAFDEDDLAYVELIASHVALASEDCRLMQSLERMAATDPLTGLFTGRYLQHALATEVSRAQRYGTAVTLMFVDLDHFKHVNDRFGHLVGRRLLREVGIVIRQALREFDIPARYGGDEFLIVLPGTDMTTALSVADAAREAIASHQFFTADGYDVQLTGSFGLATFPDHGDSARALVTAAGRAMYRAKQTQRNCVAVAETPDSAAAAHRSST